MQLLRLKVTNIRAIDTIDIDLSTPDGSPRRRLVLLGPNGAGKTTLLAAVAHLFGGFDADFGAPSLGAGDVRQQAPKDGSEAPAEATVEVEGYLSNTERSALSSLFQQAPIHGPIRRMLGQSQTDLAPILGGVVHFASPSAFEEAAGYLLRQGPGSPCLYIPAERPALSGYEEVSAASLFDFRPRLHCLSEARDRFTTLASRLALARMSKQNDPHGGVARMWKVLEAYFPDMPKPFDVRGLMLLLQTPAGAIVKLTELSHGQRAVLMLLGEVALRMPVNGIALIDEVEQHLHPRWQTAMIEALAALAPTTQFLFATQSPYLAASAPEDQLKIGDWETHGL